MNNYILELKTVQSSNIKILFEVLKEVLLSDINIVFSPDSIKVLEMDGSRVAMVHLNLLSSAFEYYYCEKKIIVGLNTNNFYKIVKIANNNDTISFYIDKNREDVMGIKMENSDESRVFKAELHLLDLPMMQWDIPKTEFKSIISLPSVKFQKYMKDLNSLGTDCKLEIKSVGQQLIFGCKGEFSDNKAILGSSDNTKFNTDSDDIIQGKFSLKFLILFTKATNLCHTVQIYLKNDYPIILEYTVGSLGSLKFVLSPIINE